MSNRLHLYKAQGTQLVSQHRQEFFGRGDDDYEYDHAEEDLDDDEGGSV